MDSLQAPQRIKHYIPNAKLIAILRHPAERAFSAYSHLVREGYETLSFPQALKKERERIGQKWLPLFYYKKQGFYYSCLKSYFDLFPRENIRIYLYDDFEADTISVIQDMFAYLGVDKTYVPDLTRKNVSGIPKSRFMYDLFTKSNVIKSTLKPLFSNKIRRQIYNTVTTKSLKPKPKLSSSMKLDLIEVYKKDILRLQDLIQQDLTAWLT